MKTQEYIQTATPRKTFWSPASAILTSWTTEPAGPIATCAVPGEDGSQYQSRTTTFQLFPQPLLRPAAPRRESHRWGVVLAGGDGIRLRELTRWLCGDDRPKQFCPLLGNRTLLEDTQQRAERSIPSEQILFSLTRAHETYYRRYLAGRQSQRIVQPLNKGTAPAILSALLRIAQADSGAIVSILPSDHYYSSESAFTASLGAALEIAERQSGSVVVLGAQPTQAEIDYGWIEIGEAVDGHLSLFRVEGFQEKPSLDSAQALFENGSLWNTFVMVGHVRAFLDMAWATVPRLMETLELMKVTSHPSGEIRIPDSVYGQIASVDFAHQILARAPDRLLAFQLTNMAWNDLGDPYRVLVTLLEKTGDLPAWAKLWPARSATPFVCHQPVRALDYGEGAQAPTQANFRSEILSTVRGC